MYRYAHCTLVILLVTSTDTTFAMTEVNLRKSNTVRAGPICSWKHAISLSEATAKTFGLLDSENQLNVDQTQLSNDSYDHVSNVISAVESSMNIDCRSIDSNKQNDAFSRQAEVLHDIAGKNKSEFGLDTLVIATPVRTMREIQIQSTPVEKNRKSRIRETPERKTTPRRQLKRMTDHVFLLSKRPMQQTSTLIGVLRLSKDDNQCSTHNQNGKRLSNESVSSPSNVLDLFQCGVPNNGPRVTTTPSKKCKTTLSLENGLNSEFDNQPAKIPVNALHTQRISSVGDTKANLIRNELNADLINEKMNEFFSVQSIGTLVSSERFESISFTNSISQ
jgi:hypothetical protein